MNELNFELISLQDVLDSLTRRPGIVVGPNAVSTLGDLSTLFESAAGTILSGDQSLVSSSCEDQRTFLDSLRAIQPELAGKYEHSIQEGLRKLLPSLDLPYLAKAGWSVCISLTQDLLFEAEVSNYLDSIPSSRTVTIVDHPSVRPPPRTIPIYKLLGNLDNSEHGCSLAIAGSDLLLREKMWPLLLKTSSDYLKDSPLIFVGTETVVDLARSVVSTLISMPQPNVSRFIFLKDDPTLSDPTVRALCAQTKVKVVDATLRDICVAISELKPRQMDLTLALNDDAKKGGLNKIYENYHSIVSIVPTEGPSGYDPGKHKQTLVDSLFRPSVTDWMPYLYEYDLRRSISGELKASVMDGLESSGSDSAQFILVRGEAGVGKTTLLKRVAVELSRDGVQVLWCRRASASNWMRMYRELNYDLSDYVKRSDHQKVRFAFICDDAFGLRLDARELMSIFEKFTGKLKFVFGIRNSDYFTNDGGGSSLPPPKEEFEVPFELDDEELEGLERMLVRIDAAKDLADAKRAVSTIPYRHATDILCSLWYLFPETQSQFSDSIRDEYCRLGAIREAIAGVAQDLASTSHVAQHAYECVTVTSNLDIGLPIEILVRTLKINYDEWIDITAEGKPLWGLLYDDKDVELETVEFRTRNEVVTRVLLDLVNGGVGHAGEVRILKELIQACDVGSSVYRNFITEVLVRKRSKLEKVLSYEQGLGLFELAKNTLSYPDRIIEHHKGVWMHHKGKELRQAYSQLEKALETPMYPGADRDAPVEHVHTSMAATLVQMVKDGSQDRITGYEQVKDHIRQASSPTFFNPHTAHVSANLLYQLAIKGKDNQFDDVSIISLSGALYEIEKALQQIGAQGSGRHSKYGGSIECLVDLKRRVLGTIPDLEDLKEFAIAKFQESGSQIGFEVAAQKMLADAIEVNKGSAYNGVKEYIDECVHLISSKEGSPSENLVSIQIDLIVRWRIQRTGGAIDWAKFRDDLEFVLKSTMHRDNIIKRFYLAVAMFQCGDVANSRAIFANIRRLKPFSLMPNNTRCYYLGPQGSPKRFQCMIQKQHDRYYATITELNTDVPVRTTSREVRAGSTIHTYVAFTLNGPIAIFDRPDASDLLMP
ncbi:MAG: ATP-binding protein [Candidatus Thiodiazotropha sp. (ex Lucinoma borealis)]|nr:ATP-binding protein [Candidatus Thiodiazotropha sp. (ex Lucinoma borealis)]